MTEVSKLIKKSKSKQCELDPVPTKLLKECCEIVVPSITKIFNLSIATSDVPIYFKQALIKPIPKKKNNTSFNNYRPISNLPFLSKLLEKVIADQLSLHRKKHKLEEQFQSAYKQHHSTESALLKISNDILLELDKGNVILMALLDLSAAFHMVDHDILLDGLYSELGITDKALNWLKSYLKKRGSCVFIDGSKSKKTITRFSIAQGSRLGPDL